MKKLAFLLAIVLCFAMVGCSAPGTAETTVGTEDTDAITTAPPEDPLYTILLEDGKQYLYLGRALVYEILNGVYEDTGYARYPSFSSLAEMKQSIEKGELSQYLLASLHRQNKNKTKIEIFNLDELYDVSLPGDMEYESVLWCGKYYSFQMVRNGQPSAIVLGDEENYDYIFRTEYEDNFGVEQTVIAEGAVEDRNATMLHYKNDTGEYKRLHYQLGSGDDVIYVTEHYTIERYDEIPVYRISDTIPDIVYVFGSVDGIPWWGMFEGLDERPSLEWFAEIQFEKI